MTEGDYSTKPHSKLIQFMLKPHSEAEHCVIYTWHKKINTRPLFDRVRQTDLSEIKLCLASLCSISKLETKESVDGTSAEMRLGHCHKVPLFDLNPDRPLEISISNTGGWTRPSIMLTTADIVGRSVGEALVHKRATFSIKSASSVEYSAPRLGSIISKRLPLSWRT